jgi:dTDP-4-amino-4,6-dideoxygalactose transaminase
MSFPNILVHNATSVRDAMSLLDRDDRTVLLVTKNGGVFDASLTKSDLDNAVLSGQSMDAPVSEIRHKQAITVCESTSRREALTLMNQHAINYLPVLDERGHVVKVMHRSEIDEPILLSTPHMGTAERAFVEDAFRTNWIAPIGPNVNAFEHEFASLVGVKYAAALSSGTAAIHIALILLGVGSGDSVFCSALTFAASANPIIYQGARPIFIDSDETSWNMSASALETAFRAATHSRNLPKAVIVVNLYGQSADMDTLRAICNRYNVPIVEDAAESLGARYKGRSSGSLGDFGTYSFNGNKIITTSGGGMLVSDRSEMIERARFLATQARDAAQHYEHSQIGYNYRMSNILAGVGRGQIQVLAERVAARRAVFDRYQKGLADIAAIEWMPEPEWSHSTRWLSTCTLNPVLTRITRTDLISTLAGEMIEARPVWKPLHLQPVFRSYEYFPHGAHSVSDKLFERGLCLPSGSNLSLDSQERIIDTIRAAFANPGNR